MPRKLAKLVATATAALLVVGTLTAVGLGNGPGGSSPRTVAISVPKATSSTASATPTVPVVQPTGAPSNVYGGSYGPVTKGKVVYLTFDDGPDPLWTPQVLAVLNRYGARATFFELGSMVTAYPAVQADVRSAGHVIGSHSATHPVLTVVGKARRHREVTGGPASHCFRPPYGASNPAVRAEIKAAGMTQILWTVDPRDWERPGARTIAQRVLAHAVAGSVILLHDGGGDRAQTVAALDRIIRTLKDRGYSFTAMTC